jgi:hypothetical protein
MLHDAIDGYLLMRRLELKHLRATTNAVRKALSGHKNPDGTTM